MITFESIMLSRSFKFLCYFSVNRNDKLYHFLWCAVENICVGHSNYILIQWLLNRALLTLKGFWCISGFHVTVFFFFSCKWVHTFLRFEKVWGFCQGSLAECLLGGILESPGLSCSMTQAQVLQGGRLIAKRQEAGWMYDDGEVETSSKEGSI